MPTPEPSSLLRLLQLVSPALPVGAYSYSEGLETLVQRDKITTAAEVTQWIVQELHWGLIRLDAAAVKAVSEAFRQNDQNTIILLNQTLSALREAEESRQQSWAMGRALNRMAVQLEPNLQPWIDTLDHSSNFAVSFALLAAQWDINPPTAVLGYLQSWTTNLIAAAIKLVPLGQTEGQKILLELTPALEATATDCMNTALEDIALSSWGTSLISMQHETLYSRLFRS